MNARNRAPWAVLAFAVCAAVIAAGVTKAVLEARESWLEEIAGADDLEDDPGPLPDREPSRVNWPKVDELIEKTTR